MGYIYGHLSGKVSILAPADDHLPPQHHEADERWPQLAHI